MCEELNFGGLCGEYWRGVKLELELVNGGRVLELGLVTAQHASGEGERAGSGQGAREGRAGGRQRLGQGRRLELGSALPG